MNEAIRAELSSVRMRVLAAMLAFMAAGLTLAGAITHSVQLGSVSDRVNAELRLELDRLESISRAGPPGRPGQPFTTVDELFRTFLQVGAPAGPGAVITLVDGDVRYVPPGDQQPNLNQEEVVARVLQDHQPGRTVYRDIETEGTTARLAIVSVRVAGDDSDGILVAGIDIGRQREEVLDSLGTYVLVSLLTLLAAGLLGFVSAGRLLSPVKRLREATETTTLEDLTKRVAVPSSHDDIAQLAHNFNMMLERLENGFTDQRRFMDDVGHELRTPLTIIRGNLELVDAQDPADVEQTRVILLDELDRMERLVGELLLLAKAQRPDFVRPGWVEINGLMEDLKDRLTPLGKRQWQVDHDASGALWADRQRIIQAVEQLAANAVKFSVEGDVVALGARWAPPPPALAAEAAADRCLQLWVRDSGRGIAPDDTQRIFERFARSSADPQVEGSGLGLAIVNAIVHAHGGIVTVESAVGLGSIFTLWLPDRPPSEDVLPATERARVRASSIHLSTRGKARL